MSRVISMRYHVLLQLGGSADTSTWLALDTGQGERRPQLVVAQQIPPQPELLQLITEQVRRASRLGSAQVTRILGLERDGEDYFVVREFVHGENLNQVLSRLGEQGGNRLPMPLALKIVADVARVLDAAHRLTNERGFPTSLVHGDVRLSNILLTFDGSVKVLDLGISAALNQRRQQSKGRTGAQMAYLAPEQCMGSWGDSRSDIFGLGVVLWEMLTNRRLYTQENSFDVIRAICDDPIDPPSLYQEAVPPFLDSLVLKATAKDPDDRFSDAHQLANSLERLLGSLNRGEAPNIKDFLQRTFPNRAPRWQSFSGVVEQGHLNDILQVARSLFAPSAPVRPENTVVRPDELERLRTQTITVNETQEVTSPTLNVRGEGKIEWDADDETSITEATRPLQNALGPGRSTAELSDITLMDSLDGSTQEVTTPGGALPDGELLPDAAPDGQFVNLGDLFDAIDSVEPTPTVLTVDDMSEDDATAQFRADEPMPADVAEKVAAAKERAAEKSAPDPSDRHVQTEILAPEPSDRPVKAPTPSPAIEGLANA
ncbi:MAG: serine/threonine protein kinase, partial [Bradymonadaceae bacterium]